MPKKPPKTEEKRRVGLNIGRANIVACEILSQDDQLILERCIQKQVAKEKPIASQIKELFAEAKFQSRAVNLSLKGQGVVVRFLSFPKMTRADFASSLQFEAEKYLPFNISEVVLDYYILNGDGEEIKQQENTMQVILVAVRKTEVDRLLNIAKEAELKLNAIDVDIFAYVNAFKFSNPDSTSQTVALLDFGAGDTTLGILDKGELTFSRDIAFGGNDLAEFIRRKLNVPVEEAFRIQHEARLTQPDQMAVLKEGLDRLFREIKSSINYYYNQHENATPIQTVYIAGGFSKLEALSELLGQQIQVPVQKWDPVSHLKVSNTVDSGALKELLPYLPVSIGLGIRPR